MFWDVKVRAFRYGKSDFINHRPAAWKLNGYSSACYDTGTSLFYMPGRLFKEMKKVMFSSMKYTQDSYGDLHSSCVLSKYESLYLLMGDTWFEVPPSVYVQSTVNPLSCFIQINFNAGDSWLLGDTFLRSYYMIWDNSGNRVGLAPHKTSQASTHSLF